MEGVTIIRVYMYYINHGQEVYITDMHRLDMVHILYIMLNFDEVYISDILPAVSIATWYIYIDTHKFRCTLNIVTPPCGMLSPM